MGERGWRSALGIWGGIVLVTTFWVRRILSVMDLGSVPMYDEAVYISQVMPGITPQEWTAPRAPGLPLLIEPITTAGATHPGIRVWMLALVATTFLLVLFVWSRTIGWGAVLGGAFFATSWVTAFHGALVLPNVMSALLVALMVGLWMLRGDVALWGAVLVALAAGLLRPFDAFFGVLACAVATFAMREQRRRLVRYAGLFAAIVSIGVPFVLYSERWGGVAARLELAEVAVPSGLRNNIPHYLSLMDGPTYIFLEKSPALAMDALLWPLFIMGGVVLGLLVAAARGWSNLRRPGSRALIVLTAAAVLSVAPYLFYFGEDASLAIRFLIPAFLLGSLAWGHAMLVLFEGRRALIGIMVGLAAVSIVAPAQSEVGERIAGEWALDSTDGYAFARMIEKWTGDEPCSVLSTRTTATFGVLTGCPTRRYRGDEDVQWLRAERARGRRVVVIGNPEHERSPFAEWRSARYQGHRGWVDVYFG